MATTSELFRKIDRRLTERRGDDHPLSDVIQFQCRLAQMIEACLTEAQKEAKLDFSFLGYFNIQHGPRPHSSTGEIVYIQRGKHRLALKFLTQMDSTGQLILNPDQTYAFQDPAVRTMTALGEGLMGTASNKDVDQQFYKGIAGVVHLSYEKLELVPLKMRQVLKGKMEPVIVMMMMDASLVDPFFEEARVGKQPNSPDNTEKQKELVLQVVRQVIGASVPLPADLATQIGSPEEVEALLTAKTIGWLAGRTEETEPRIVEAVHQAQAVQALLRKFFTIPETRTQLELRAVGQIGEPGQERLAQTFGPGDTKLSNVLEKNGVCGLFDPQWLILREGILGNEKPMFAPWPFADLMQVIAFTATQTLAYDHPELKEVIQAELSRYYGQQWGHWHDLYFDLLIAYKLLVDLAYNIDPYQQKIQAGVEIPVSLQVIIERHGQLAVELCQQALATYFQKELNGQSITDQKNS